MSALRSCGKLTVAILLTVGDAGTLSAQTQSGAAFLKIPVGARQQGMSGSMTAGLDELHIIYTNPAASGFFREWQWSAGYTEWFGDIYNASFTYGRQLKLQTPWSNRLNIAAGLNYQGIREFDSSGGAQPAAAANDLVVSLALGTPMSVISDNLGVGITTKYFRSELAALDATSFLLDLGLQYKTPRFSLGNSLFRYGYFSAGMAATQIGQSLTFLSSATPLPRTYRAGLAFNLGTHDGVQLQLSGDYQEVRDENGRVAFGLELTNLLTSLNSDLGRLLDLRGGYGFDENLLNKFSFGLSFKVDDYMQGPLRKLVGRNSAARLDASVLSNNEFASTVYRGSVTYYANRPEKFHFGIPSGTTFAYGDTIRLAWGMSSDPDLYDDVDYLLVFVREDKQMLSEMVTSIENYELDLFQLFESKPLENHDDRIKVTSLFLTSAQDNFTSLDGPLKDFYSVSTAQYLRKDSSVRHDLEGGLQPGEYHWAVIAYDENHHSRFAVLGNDRLNSFRVEVPEFTKPDLTISIVNSSVPELPPLSPDLEAVHYMPNSSTLTPEASKILASWLDFIEKNPLVEFEIGGHADKTGPQPAELRKRYNQSLSERRAQNVVRHLIKNGVNTFRIRARGYGEDLPIIDETTATAYEQNRRVEIKVSKDYRIPKYHHFADVTIKNSGQTPATGVAVAIFDLGEGEVEALETQFASSTPVVIKEPENGTDVDKPRLLQDSLIPEITPGDSATIRVECDPERPFVVAVIDGDNFVDELNELNNWNMARLILPATEVVFPNAEKGTFNFGFNSHNLMPGTQQLLTDLAAFLKQYPNVRIQVEGHADSRGTETYNMRLSRRRAESVSAFLLENDIPSVRVKTVGLGEKQPLVEEENEEAWAKNRRVEVLLFND
jgi:outer membrane protein OmpA-like peptidoglycan-associated protein